MSYAQKKKAIKQVDPFALISVFKAYKDDSFNVLWDGLLHSISNSLQLKYYTAWKVVIGLKLNFDTYSRRMQ